MNSSHPEPGSPWHCHCPEAFPREWLNGAKKIPDGFERVAESRESELIRGRITEAEFLGTALPTSTSPKSGKRKRKKSPPVVRKVKGYTLFFESTKSSEPKLSFAAVGLWCWLWTCEKEGEVRLARCNRGRLGGHSAKLGIDPSSFGVDPSRLRVACRRSCAGRVRDRTLTLHHSDAARDESDDQKCDCRAKQPPRAAQPPRLGSALAVGVGLGSLDERELVRSEEFAINCACCREPRAAKEMAVVATRVEP